MGTAKSVFAELQRIQREAERKQRQAQQTASRAHAAAVREAERAAKESERARVAATRASEADRKRAEAEAKQRHLESMLAEVESRNAAIAETEDQLASILAATIDVDDYVDLETFRRRVSHPPFDRPDLQTPTPLPAAIVAPPEPVYVEPDPPASGLGGLLGGAKKKHAQLVEDARNQYWAAHAQWEAIVAQVPAAQYQQATQHQQREQHRQSALERAYAEYQRQCTEREAEAARVNASLDQFLQALALNDQAAVEEYVRIVLANSAYPDVFQVEHAFEYDAELHDLFLTVWVPSPSSMPTVKEYRYVKASDEITPKQFGVREMKVRYADAIAQTAVRSLHEVFEADRDGRIATMTVIVATQALDTATGQPQQIGFVAVAADRERVLAFDLANVVPSDTLAHLKAVVSKDPFALVGIDVSNGVRG